ncbi:MAG: tetratricopeptide repeat protein [Ahniella sp.]|nr:tetratricopeptide repeat protein [Ahniella sp.]
MQLGRVHNFQSRWNDAEHVLRLGLESLRGTADGLLIAGLQRQLAVCLINQERPQDAEAAAQSALAHLNGLQPVPVHEIVDTEMLLATIAYSRGDLPSAQAAYARIVQAQRGDTEQAGLVTSLNNLAAIELRLDRLDESIAHYRESIALARARYGARNREVALPLVGLGSALRAAGDRESALSALRESQSIYADWAGTAHPETAYASLLLAEMLWLEGDIGAARAALKGVTTVLAADGAQSIKACRARLLELALLDTDDTAADPREDAIACLSTPQAPANLRLMARWVALSRGLGDDDLETLQREAAALVPRDGALQRAISLLPAGHRRETE